MLTNARDNEEKGKERNADLLKSIEKMERKLAATGADMTRLKDAQRSFQDYVESCLPEWRKKVRGYQQQKGKLQFHGAIQNSTKDENLLFLGSQSTPKHKSETTISVGT
jgi:hypothetical protein